MQGTTRRATARNLLDKAQKPRANHTLHPLNAKKAPPSVQGGKRRVAQSATRRSAAISARQKIWRMRRGEAARGAECDPARRHDRKNAPRKARNTGRGTVKKHGECAEGGRARGAECDPAFGSDGCAAKRLAAAAWGVLNRFVHQKRRKQKAEIGKSLQAGGADKKTQPSAQCCAVTGSVSRKNPSSQREVRPSIKQKHRHSARCRLRIKQKHSHSARRRLRIKQKHSHSARYRRRIKQKHRHSARYRPCIKQKHCHSARCRLCIRQKGTVAAKNSAAVRTCRPPRPSQSGLFLICAYLRGYFVGVFDLFSVTIKSLSVSGRTV